MAEWQPIETAPENWNFAIDLWWDNGPGEQFRVPDCWYRDPDSWKDDHGNIIPREYVTHWMMPAGPPE